jgi:transposase-like protein
VKPLQVQRRLTPQQAERLVAEYQAGADIQELASRWGMHRATVTAHLPRPGVPLRRQGVPAESQQEAIRLYGEGWSW